MKEMLVGSAAPAPAGRWGAASPQALLERMKDYGQEGAFALWDELSPEERELLVRDIEGTWLGSSDPKGCFMQHFALLFQQYIEGFLSENPESTEAKIFQINLDNGLKAMARKGSYVPLSIFLHSGLQASDLVSLISP